MPVIFTANIEKTHFIMNASVQAKFNEVIKESFQKILKPLGFRKKSQRFYLHLPEVTQMIDVQKVNLHEKERIDFTVNISIFEPRFWSEFYNSNLTQDLPEFPAESDCLIRKRIGGLKNADDIVYTINHDTDKDKLTNEIQSDITQYMLPFLESLNSIAKISQQLETHTETACFPLAEMIFYARHNQLSKAQSVYETLLASANPMALSKIKSFGKRYGLKV